MGQPPEYPWPVEVLRLASGRELAVEVVGAGADRQPAVLVLHGTPDSRLATPPDPTVSGVTQLLADRPGFGDSSVDPQATPASVADDLAAACRLLGYEDVGVVSWSAGSLFALALAERHPSLVSRMVLAAPLAPAEAWEQTAPDRFRFDAGDIADIVPFLVPPGLNLDGAIRIALGDSPARQREILAVPGAAERLGRAVLASVQAGPAGLERDLAAQLHSPQWSAITAPCHLVLGGEDTTCPPAMGRWMAARLVSASVTVEELPGAGHAFPLRRWSRLVNRAGSNP
ncbi:MAG: alpha/beta hydrolase [Microthrixaceae bacterium]